LSSAFTLKQFQPVVRQNTPIDIGHYVANWNMKSTQGHLEKSSFRRSRASGILILD
jgi:hypothetical protein